MIKYLILATSFLLQFSSVKGQNIIDTIVVENIKYYLESISPEEYDRIASINHNSLQYNCAGIACYNNIYRPKNKNFEITDNVKIKMDSLIVQTKMASHIFHNKQAGEGTHIFHYIDYIDFLSSFIVYIQYWESHRTMLINSRNGDIYYLPSFSLEFHPNNKMLLGINSDPDESSVGVDLYVWNGRQELKNTFSYSLPLKNMDEYFMNDKGEIFIKCSEYNEQNEHNMVYYKFYNLNKTKY